MTAQEREIIVKAGKYPYSPVVAFDNLVFISGSVGRDPQTGEMSPDIAEQTRQVMTKIQKLLEQAGTSFDRALKVTIYLTNMAEFGQMNEAYGTFFSGEFPSRSCIQVVALPDPQARVEIDVISAR